MSLKREIFLWKTRKKGSRTVRERLVVYARALTCCNIGRFGEAEGEPTAFFEANHHRGSLIWRFAGRDFAARNLGIAGVSAHKQAGGLNRQACASQVDRIESQPYIAVIALDRGDAGGLHATANRGTARNQSISFDHHGVVNHRLERSVGAGILRGHGILQPNREQCAGRQILRFVERKTSFTVPAIHFSCRRISLTGGCACFMKRNRILVGMKSRIVTLRPRRTSATRRPEQDQQEQPNRQTLRSAEPAHENYPRPRFFDKEVATRIPDTVSSNQPLGDGTFG